MILRERSLVTLLACLPAHSLAEAAEGRLLELEREVQRSEYSYTRSADGEYSAPNRSQGLRSRIGPDGLELVPRAVGSE